MFIINYILLPAVILCTLLMIGCLWVSSEQRRYYFNDAVFWAKCAKWLAAVITVLLAVILGYVLGGYNAVHG